MDEQCFYNVGVWVQPSLFNEVLEIIRARANVTYIERASRIYCEVLVRMPMLNPANNTEFEIAERELETLLGPYARKYGLRLICYGRITK